MLFRNVASNTIPDKADDQSQNCTDPKWPSPTVVDHQVGHKNRGSACACPNAGEDQTVGKTPLLRGNPLRNELVGSGIDDGFACAEQEANKNKAGKGSSDRRRQRCRERREDSPPNNADREHVARAEPARQPSARCLKNGIAKQKSAKDRAELNLGEMVFLGQGSTGNRDIDPVEIGNCTQNEQPEHQEPAHSAGGLVSHEYFPYQKMNRSRYPRHCDRLASN